jgi:hypothetical protein
MWRPYNMNLNLTHVRLMKIYRFVFSFMKIQCLDMTNYLLVLIIAQINRSTVTTPHIVLTVWVILYFFQSNHLAYGRHSESKRINKRVCVSHYSDGWQRRCNYGNDSCKQITRLNWVGDGGCFGGCFGGCARYRWRSHRFDRLIIVSRPGKSDAASAGHSWPSHWIDPTHAKRAGWPKIIPIDASWLHSLLYYDALYTIHIEMCM